MAVRIRKNGQILCAAKSKPQKGDCYIDDNIHHILCAELKVLSVEGYLNNGCDVWEFHTPMNLNIRIKKEERARNNILKEFL